MASYNGARFIEEQIISILNQLGINDELIISDDGSTDETINIIKRIEDDRIKLVVNKGERGYTKNFENALKNATGEIFFLSDQDDVWLPTKVSKCIDVLKTSNFVMSDAYLTDTNLNRKEYTHFDCHNVKKGFFINLLKTRYVGAFMAFDKNVYDYIMPFPKKSKLSPHDYWITLVVESKFKTTLIHEPLVLYRRHDSNLTGKRQGRTLYLMIMQRLYSLFSLQNRNIRR